jgi:hypothetical protein
MVHLVIAVVGAYLLAGIPVGAFALLGRMSPVYRFPREALIRYWSWGALVVVVTATLYSALS